MLLISYYHFIYFFPLIWSCVVIWRLFFFFNIIKIRIKSVNLTDHQLKSSYVSKITTPFLSSVFLDFLLLSCSFILINFFIFKGLDYWIFFDIFYCSNFLYYYMWYFSWLFFLCIIIFRQTFLLLLLHNYMFFCMMFNFFIFSLLLFLTKSMLSFFFLFEILSIITFLQFIMTKSFYQSQTQTLNTSAATLHQKLLVNTLFFQYWVSFFSTILFVYVLALILYLFGSTDWFILNFFSLVTSELSLTNSLTLKFVIFCFFFAFFLKLGFAPFHLFKVEIYKNISYLIILVYNFFYFLIFFVFFSFISCFYFASNWFISWLFFFLILIGGSSSLIYLMFDIKLVKAFFAYSTVLNVLSLCCFMLGFLTI